MRRLAFLIAVIASGSLVLIAPDRAVASVSVGVDINLFHDSLSPYGDWIQSARYGSVWTPRHVGHGWRPYTTGHWVYTDYDWTWASDDEWGWATDHYGRWAFDPEYGWIWVPGNEWAPAWVAWRSGGGYIGWAPLPPRADAFRVGVDFGIDAFAYSFVETRHFCEPRVYNHYAPVARNVTFINVTQNVTNYTVVNNRIINRGVDVRRIEHVTGHAVPRSQIREVGSARDARGGRIERGQVAVFRPHASTDAADRRHDVRASVPRERAENLPRRQEQERRRLDSAEQRERTELRKVHEREVRRPPVSSRAERRPEVNSRRADVAPSGPASQPRRSRVRSDERSSRPVDRGQVREFHQQEVRAQGQHETRERQGLAQRQERERRATPAPAPKADSSAEKAKPPKHGHH